GRKIEEILSTVPNDWSKEDLKSKVSDALIEEFDPIQKRINDLMNTEEGQSTIVNCLSHGSRRANQLATKRLELIYSAIGWIILPSHWSHNQHYANAIKMISVVL
ncbi:unnamed protein product, partial [Schistosoma curassoni]